MRPSTQNDARGPETPGNACENPGRCQCTIGRVRNQDTVHVRLLTHTRPEGVEGVTVESTRRGHMSPAHLSKLPTLTLQGTGIVSDVLVTQTSEFSIISTAIKSTEPQTSPSGCSTATGQHVKDQTHHHPHRVFPDCPLRVTCWHRRSAFWVTCCAPASLSAPLSQCTLCQALLSLSWVTSFPTEAKATPSGGERVTAPPVTPLVQERN